MPPPAAPVNKFASNACEIPSAQYDGGQHAMDNLPSWALWIITAAVGISPELTILSTPKIARLLHRLLFPRSKVAPKRDSDEPAGVAVIAG